jgi:hypothetical protein
MRKKVPLWSPHVFHYAEPGSGAVHARGGRRGGTGKADLGPEPAARSRADDQGSAVGLGDRPDDRQADADALPVTEAVRAKPLERLKEPVNGPGRHDGPGVDHRQDGLGA